MAHEFLTPYRRPEWQILAGDGPILVTAVHDGHQVDDNLLDKYAIDAATHRREEYPITGLWASVGDHHFRNFQSRFQVDLNRERERAVYRTPEDAWGLHVWDEAPSDERAERMLRPWDDFYALMRQWVDAMIDEHGTVVVLGIHSYNHRRVGPFGQPGAQEDNPDIDLGVTTTDPNKFGHLVDRLHSELEKHPAAGRKLDVRRNVRYPDGGHWPEWVQAEFGEHVATITLEYKKFYMDEWTGEVFLPVIEDLRRGVQATAAALREELRR